MANYKVVDADQLNADLTSVADAVREKSSTSDQMAFPDGFVSAVKGIPDALEQKLNGTLKEFSSNVTKTGTYPFTELTSLEKLSLPNITLLGYFFATSCTNLREVNVPSAKSVTDSAFKKCTSLKKIRLPSVTSIEANSFSFSGMEALILPIETQVCPLKNTNALYSTPIANGTGYVYVPRSLVDSYKAETNWTTFANQIRAIEDYPEITGG